MVASRRFWIVSGLCLLASACWGVPASRAQSGGSLPPALEGPLGGEPVAAPDASGGAIVPGVATPPSARPASVRAPKSPPPPLAESPGARPDAGSQWIAGYWTWDASRRDFAWVPGVWRVAPSGMIWVDGRWARDADGWSRVPGFWSRRQPGASPPATTTTTTTVTSTIAEPTPVITAARAPVWRQTGPPATRPDESPGPAPGPDFFYVPGQYTPTGERVNWTPGYWARAQPGWEWVPARWVHRGDGWDYRAGSWVRDADAVETRRYTVSRPAGLSGRSPTVVESEPAGAETPRDVIAEAEDGARAARVIPVVPVYPPYGGYRYGPVPPPYGVMIRPPGYPPYGSRGVIVSPAVPPFVQRLLNRVLP